MDSVGINIDVFDQELRELLTPGKAKIGRGTYTLAWDYALKIFGENQVSTFLLTGLMEKRENREDAIKFICENGVIPFVVPHRPIEETKCDHYRTNDAMLASALVYAKEAMEEHGLDIFKSKAGCPRCGACTALREVVEHDIR